MSSALPSSASQRSESQASIPNLRQIVLGVNVAIAALVLGKAVLDPTVGKPRPFDLPETVELNQWTLTDSEKLDPFTLITGESDYSDEGRRYTFTFTPNSSPNGSLNGLTPQDEQATLTIEMRYMIDTNGFIERLLMGHKEFQASLAALDEEGVDTSKLGADIQYQPGIGYSGKFQLENTEYLSACINPRGESTFFIDQFLHNQSIYDHDPTRLLPVLFGRQAWTDQRCLWTHMRLSPGASGTELSPNAVALSTAPSTTLSKDLSDLLDDTWAEWHDMWQPQFPKR